MAIKLVDDLLKEYRKDKCCKEPEKLIFEEVYGYDVYNPTSVFNYNGKNVICARVEKRDSEHSQAIFFYEKEKNHFYPLENIKRFELQDPYITKIGEYYIFGGTEIFPHPDDNTKLWWHAKFYYGTSLEDLKELVTGPKGMKDIRIVELKDKTIGVFSRPQGEKGGRGKIGFTTVPNIFALNGDIIQDAPLLNQFDDLEWGGVNEPTLLEDGRIGVLGHIAKFTGNDIRHYYPMVFTINPERKEYSNIKIIAERIDFVDGPSKRDDLQDVLFSGGLVNLQNGFCTLYVGVSDCEVQKITIKNPFN